MTEYVREPLPALLEGLRRTELDAPDAKVTRRSLFNDVSLGKAWISFHGFADDAAWVMTGSTTRLPRIGQIDDGAVQTIHHGIHEIAHGTTNTVMWGAVALIPTRGVVVNTVEMWFPEGHDYCFDPHRMRVGVYDVAADPQFTVRQFVDFEGELDDAGDGVEMGPAALGMFIHGMLCQVRAACFGMQQARRKEADGEGTEP